MACEELQTCALCLPWTSEWGSRADRRQRTFLGSLRPNERTPTVSDTLFGWIGEFYSIPDTWVLNHHTLDGYLFLRFLKISVVCCLVGCLITWPVLFPLNITGGVGKSELDILTMAVGLITMYSPRRD